MVLYEQKWECSCMSVNSSMFVTVVMHKDKDDGMHRSRDLTAFDHTLLDGEMFLQVYTYIFYRNTPLHNVIIICKI